MNELRGCIRRHVCAAHIEDGTVFLPIVERAASRRVFARQSAATRHPGHAPTVTGASVCVLASHPKCEISVSLAAASDSLDKVSMGRKPFERNSLRFAHWVPFVASLALPLAYACGAG